MKDIFSEASFYSFFVAFQEPQRYRPFFTGKGGTFQTNAAKGYCQEKTNKDIREKMVASVNLDDFETRACSNISKNRGCTKICWTFARFLTSRNFYDLIM